MKQAEIPGKQAEDKDGHREPGTQPFDVRVKKPVTTDGKEHTPRLPHERDESEDSQDAGPPRKDMKQAYDDIMSGQVDTDLREQRGVEETVKDKYGRSPGRTEK